LSAQLPAGATVGDVIVDVFGPAVGGLVEHPAIVTVTNMVPSTSLAIFTVLPLSPFPSRRFRRKIGA
jgi:hypothetical protein